MSKTFYHYTIADRLVKILISGYLKLCPEKPLPNEPQLVWVTSNPEWDKTAFFGYPDEVLDNAGRIRITLKSQYAPHNNYYIPNQYNLETTARMVGVNPYDWGVSHEVIPIADFEKVELWRDGKWEEVPCLMK